MLRKLGLNRPRDFAFAGWIAILSAAIVLGVVTAIRVFIHGLAITNLSNQVPWGLWITVDLSSIALSGGAFFLSALVYIAGIKRFKPIARIAVFIGLLGYSAALCTLLMDIGRPDRFYHPLVFWNIHSMLWEVTMCICLYFSVLLMEVFPLVTSHSFFDRLPRVRQLAERIHTAAPVLAFMGLGFSLLHQSSLGATYGVIAARPIWFRPTMPLLFITSAIAAGPALTMAAAMVVGWLRGKDIVPRQVLFDVGRITAVILLIYLYMRFWDTTAGNYGYVPLRTEATAVLTNGSLAMSFWSWEIVLGGIAPAVLMFYAAAVKSEAALFTGSGMTVIGLVMNRWHTTIIGFLTPLTNGPSITYPLTPTYTPAFTEWAVAIGIVSGVLLAFTLGVRFLPAFDPDSAAMDAHAHAAGD